MIVWIILALMLVAPLIVAFTSFAVGRISLDVPSRQLELLEAEKLIGDIQGKGAQGIEEVPAPWEMPSIDISVSILPESREVFPGGALKVMISVVASDMLEHEIGFGYLITGMGRNVAYSEYETRSLSGNLSFIQEMKIPEDIKPGAYVLSVLLSSGDKDIAAEHVTFIVKEKEVLIPIMPTEIKKIRNIAIGIAASFFSLAAIYLIIRFYKLRFWKH